MTDVTVTKDFTRKVFQFVYDNCKSKGDWMKMISKTKISAHMRTDENKDTVYVMVTLSLESFLKFKYMREHTQKVGKQSIKYYGVTTLGKTTFETKFKEDKLKEIKEQFLKS